MKKYCLIFILLLSACVSTTEYMQDRQQNTVYKTICSGMYSPSQCAAKTIEICPNQLKSAKGYFYYDGAYFSEVLFVCRDKIEVK